MFESLPEDTAQRAQAYVEAGLWPNITIMDRFDDAVQRTPNKVAVVAPNGARLTYAELAAKVECVAKGLADVGVGKGDVVSIQLPSGPEAVIGHLAASHLGAVTNPLLPNYRAKELTYILGFARTKVAIIPSHYRNFDYVGMYAQLRPTLPDLAAVFVVGADGGEGMTPYRELEATVGSVAPAAADGNDITALIFTSGTESTPKGVMHSHNTAMYSTIHMAQLMGLTADDVIWAPSPIGHGTGFQWGVRQAITLGATLVLQDIWDPEEALRIIEAERCSFVLSATPFVVMLLETPSLGSRDLSSLRIFGCAGAPIPRQLGERARKEIGCTLVGMWGMSECFVGSASAPDEADEKLWATDGCAMPGGELAIFDDDRKKILPSGEIGELATRGPHVALGYFNDPERSASTFRSDGWLFSNDLATMDEDGYIRIVGRKKDIINRGGLKIASREIEDILVEHPKISRIALVPIPDDRLGEKGCACVVLRDAVTLNLSELTDFLIERGVAKYKLPEFLVLLPELPMTASGKVQKFQLRDSILDGTLPTVATSSE